MKQILLISMVTLSLPALADCLKQAESAAISAEKKDSKDPNLAAKNTSKFTDAVKADEEAYYTEVHDSEGAFVPYDVFLKKKNCKVVSVKATTL